MKAYFLAQENVFEIWREIEDELFERIVELICNL